MTWLAHLLQPLLQDGRQLDDVVERRTAEDEEDPDSALSRAGRAEAWDRGRGAEGGGCQSETDGLSWVLNGTPPPAPPSRGGVT